MPCRPSFRYVVPVSDGESHRLVETEASGPCTCSSVRPPVCDLLPHNRRPIPDGDATRRPRSTRRSPSAGRGGRRHGGSSPMPDTRRPAAAARATSFHSGTSASSCHSKARPSMSAGAPSSRSGIRACIMVDCDSTANPCSSSPAPRWAQDAGTPYRAGPTPQPSPAVIRWHPRRCALPEAASSRAWRPSSDPGSDSSHRSSASSRRSPGSRPSDQRGSLRSGNQRAAAATSRSPSMAHTISATPG